ncbi:unnamed protein product [Schistosoma turkestanicum]|nr:unnamed protein product [Schistosoma turkestanicum]
MSLHSERFIYIIKTSIFNFRANVTLKLSLSTDFSTECDDTVYKVVVCAGEFTNQCQLVGPISRFMQTTCAFQGPPESISFLISSVESPIELKVTVQKVGEPKIQQLRNTEFRLPEENELAVTSSDLSLIVRFHVAYSCLPNYFGKFCTKFCDIKAMEYRCDHLGNMLCKPGYYMDQKLQLCRLDQCANYKNYCLNDGLCMNNPNADANDTPLCICPTHYKGLRCELKNQMFTNLPPGSVNTPRLKTDEFNKNNSVQHKPLLNITTTTTDSVQVKPKDIDKKQETKLLNSKDNSSISTQSIPITQHSVNSVTNNPLALSTSPIASFTEIVVPMKNSKYIIGQNWRKIIIISSVGLALIITISIGCIGLVFCLMRRKPKKTDKKSNISSIITQDSGCNYKSARQWTSIDPSSPNGLNYHDSSEYKIFSGNTIDGMIDTGTVYPIPFSESMLQANTNIDGNYGMYDFSSTQNYYQNQHQEQQRNQQAYRHSSLGTTGYHGEYLPANGFATMPKNLYLSNRHMTWHDTVKQPSCCVTSVQQLPLDKHSFNENVDSFNGRSMINLNTYHPNDPYKINEHSRFPVNLDHSMMTNSSDNNNNNHNDNSSKYLQPSYNLLSSSLHDGYVTNGYFDQLLNNKGRDYTNQNDNYITNENNNYMLYKTIQDTTTNLNSNDYNQFPLKTSTLPPTISFTSSLKAPPVIQAMPLSPPPPTQFSDFNHY